MPAAGPSIDEMVVGDEPDAWRAGGFSVDDDGICRVGRVRVRLVGPDDGTRVRSWSLRGVGGGDIDGIPTVRSDTEPCAPARHANGAQLIDHVVVTSPDLDRTSRAIQNEGLELLRTRAAGTTGATMRQHFFRLDEVILELVGAPGSHGEGPAAVFGLAHTVSDLDATVELLSGHLGEVKDAVQPGRRIVTLRHRALGMSVATAFMSP